MGAYSTFSTEELNDLRAKYKDALIRIAEVGISHTISGRTFTAANLPDIERILENISDELASRSGRMHTRTRVNFNRSFM